MCDMVRWLGSQLDADAAPSMRSAPLASTVEV